MGHHSQRGTKMLAGLELVRRGGFPGKFPFGYRAGASRGLPEVCSIEAPAVVRGLDLLASHSVGETAAKLSAEGFKTRVGTRITPAIVRGMLTNTLVVGIVKWPSAQSSSGRGAIVSANERYRIVTDELWQRARKASGPKETRRNDESRATSSAGSLRRRPIH